METSIQETLYPTLTCFGCGQANADGLHLKSYERGGIVVASFTSGPHHDNGVGFLNGGIITTVLDCHTAAVVMVEAHKSGWQPTDEVPLAFVTAGFDVRFLRPTPLAAPVELTAKLVSADDQAVIVDAELLFEAKVRATMRATWKRFRPRRAASNT